MQVTINEIYPCIVGESLQAGLPATLVRLSGCNLACDYCDSRYACVESGQRRGVEEVASALAASPLPRTLITGGEPMLQEDAVVELAAALLRTGHEVLLETNGTLPLARVPAAVIKVVDVKTPGAQAGVPFLAENYRFLQPHDQLKLVLTGREDYVWAKGFLAAFPPPVPLGNVLFSCAWNRLAPARLAEWLLADRLPVRLHVQFHKVLFGERRGV
jgi:7-carboxy-7-deazaguanine synthase